MTKSKLKNKLARTKTLEQWIEIKRINGKTVSTFYPPNRELEEIRIKMNPQPSLIYRRLHFVHGVPYQYAWTNAPAQARIAGGLYLLRLTVGDWLTVLQHESRQLQPHVTRAPSQPRPADFGPCPCARCTTARQSSPLA